MVGYIILRSIHCFLTLVFALSYYAFSHFPTSQLIPIVGEVGRGRPLLRSFPTTSEPRPNRSFLAICLEIPGTIFIL